jgi:hypothetical protein
MTLILATLTFMYVSARSVGDNDYKRDVLAPLVEDLHVTLPATAFAANNGPRADIAGGHRDRYGAA